LINENTTNKYGLLFQQLWGCHVSCLVIGYDFFEFWKLQWKSCRPKMGQGLLTTCLDIIWFFFKNISFEITHNFQRTFKLKIFTLLFHSWLMSIWATNNVSWISKFTFKSDNLIGRFLDWSYNIFIFFLRPCNWA
jgi:hypothetical protein